MWMKKEEEKKATTGNQHFIRGEFMGVSSSGESTASTDSEEGGSKSVFYIPKPTNNESNATVKEQQQVITRDSIEYLSFYFFFFNFGVGCSFII